MSTFSIIRTTVHQSHALNFDVPPSGLHIMWANANCTGTKPTDIGGNSFLVLSYCSLNTTTGVPYYGIQFAIGFGSRVAAIRTAPYNASGSTWNAWRYIRAANFDQYLISSTANLPTIFDSLIEHYPCPVWLANSATNSIAGFNAQAHGIVTRLTSDIMDMFVTSSNEKIFGIRYNRSTNSTSVVHAIDYSSVMAIQTQLLLPSSVTITSGSTANVLNGTNIRNLTKSALTDIPATGTIKGIVYLWSSGGGCVAVDTLVSSNTSCTLKIRNVTASTLTISELRLLVFVSAY